MKEQDEKEEEKSEEGLHLFLVVGACSRSVRACVHLYTFLHIPKRNSGESIGAWKMLPHINRAQTKEIKDGTSGVWITFIYIRLRILLESYSVSVLK